MKRYPIFALIVLVLMTLGQKAAWAFPTSEDLEAAAAGALPRVEQGNEPPGAAFFSWQNPWWPPFPAPFLDGADEWDLGNGDILVDDRFFSYEILTQANELQLWGSESGPLEVNGVGAGCGLFLSISFSNATTFVLTLHNTRPWETYSIWSTTNLTLGQFTTNWVLETNLLGASGDFTEALIAKGDRSDLFLRASELRDYKVDTNFTFTGLVYTNTIVNPPDTMGAIGPDHFVELLNGSDFSIASIAVYTRTGSLVASARSTDFFALTNGEIVFPKSRQVSDPRVLFDHHAQRWLATAFDTNFVLLAVSQTDNPTNLNTGWTRYAIQMVTDGNADFPTLGVDDNGIYIAAAQRLGSGVWTRPTTGASGLYSNITVRLIPSLTCHIGQQ